MNSVGALILLNPQQAVDLGSLSKVLEVHEKLLNLKSPLGSKESPARSCLDLFLDDPEISDGIL